MSNGEQLKAPHMQQHYACQHTVSQQLASVHACACVVGSGSRTGRHSDSSASCLTRTHIACWHVGCCRYQSPAQREQAFAAAQRQQKEAAAAQAAALVKQYGPEGAAATEYILTKKKLNRPYIHIKTFKEDVEAVHELPAAGLPSP